MNLLAVLMVASTTAKPSLGDRLVANVLLQRRLPLTVSEATNANWTAVTGDPTACDAVSGRRFRLGEHLTPTLIFDNTNRLAGLQMVVNDTTDPPYPQSNVRSPPFFSASGDRPSTSTMAVHFKDPAKLCSAKAADHEAGSIGDRLWVRLGTASAQAADFEQIPLSLTELQAGQADTGWTPGDCIASSSLYPGSAGMGTHYWRYLSDTSQCKDIGPLFLMYDRGALSAFGFVCHWGIEPKRIHIC